MSIPFAISQIGLVIYMFLIGLEFNTDLIKQRIKSAGLISGAGIIAPFTLGAAATVLLYKNSELFKPGVILWADALYLGASMSITAFPMLARMLYERGIAKTRFGTLDDATAWCLLPIVLASLKANISITTFAIGGGIGYVLFTTFVGRPALTIFTRMTNRDGSVTIQTLTLVLILLL
jgi:Kef-type K+ transport system membrane component KefB